MAFSASPRYRYFVAGLSFIFGAFCGVSSAADKPPLHVLVGYAAGGATDTLARILAAELSQSLNRAVVVDNKPGAGGRIAAAALKNAPADGSTVMLSPNGLTSIQTIIYKDEPSFDPTKDLVPVAKLVNTPITLVVSKNINVTDAKQLQAWIKANPNQANFGSPGAGSLPHFVGVLIAQAMEENWNHVAYKGGSPVAAALLTGEIPIGLSTIEDFLKYDEVGKLKVIGVASAKRSTFATRIPTLLEQGFDVKAEGWTAMWTNPGTTAVQINEISAALRKALSMPSVRAKLAITSTEVDFQDAASLALLQKAELTLWAPIIKASGFKPGN